jgi:hypothetical protein
MDFSQLTAHWYWETPVIPLIGTIPRERVEDLTNFSGIL